MSSGLKFECPRGRIQTRGSSLFQITGEHTQPAETLSRSRSSLADLFGDYQNMEKTPEMDSTIDSKDSLNA